MANGRCRLITSNALSGLTVTNVTADTGYSNTSLTDDVVAKAWRGTAASSFEFRINRGSSWTQLSWVGVFDLTPVTAGVYVTRVYVKDSPDGTTVSAERGSFGVNSRGDGGALVPGLNQWQHIFVDLSGSSKLDCGLLFAGTAIDLPKTFSRRQQSRDRGVVVNDTEGGGTYAGRLRSYRTVVSLDWAVLTDAQHAALEGVESDTGGQYTPLVLIPDTKVPAELYHGRLEEVQTWKQEPGAYYEGHSLAFRESGRAL